MSVVHRLLRLLLVLPLLLPTLARAALTEEKHRLAPQRDKKAPLLLSIKSLFKKALSGGGGGGSRKPTKGVGSPTLSPLASTGSTSVSPTLAPQPRPVPTRVPVSPSPTLAPTKQPATARPTLRPTVSTLKPTTGPCRWLFY